jgi:hypothetical protein
VVNKSFIKSILLSLILCLVFPISSVLAVEPGLVQSTEPPAATSASTCYLKVGWGFAELSLVVAGIYFAAPGFMDFSTSEDIYYAIVAAIAYAKANLDIGKAAEAAVGDLPTGC